ncbi:MAG: PAS domain-containing protein [Cyanosarcina radialis HA8281-LM2]|jgi:two-component system CheB/CheR fusion protein|nr:PAS domain-containing protein [Cyanosarcina radialis HA8281-LM2]
MTTSNDPIFEALLDHLRRTRGFDFSGYKRSSLTRRVLKRMQELDIDSFENYLDYLEVYPDEFTYLFNTILINVTGFFRDPAAWEYLDRNIIPKLLEHKTGNKPIRIWSAGCASGEEAYTLAMLMVEHLGAEQFRQRVKIYATDVDEEALVQARHASYTEKSLQPVPEELREKYFDLVGSHYVFRTDLRRSVIFGRHDLVQDAPISRLDLLVCRNALMYFNAEIQTRILTRFHFALTEQGYLFLGKAEMLLTHADLFVPVSLRHRIFHKVAKVSLRDRLLVLAQNEEQGVDMHVTRMTRLREAALETSSLAQIIVSADGTLRLANHAARLLFDLAPGDLGRPLQDLPLSYRPLELRSQIDRVYSDRRPVMAEDVQRSLPNGGIQYLDVQFTPLQDHDRDVIGCSITFQDVSPVHQLQQDLQQSNQELETANEELQSSNEELETTNEELQSTNEELETTNEELQATNEELETINEELQSTNEELEATNEEMRQRTDELNNANAFLESILAGLRAGVVVIDNRFDVLTWNIWAEDLWGLRADEVQGRSFFNLDIGLPVDQLRSPIRNCLAGESLTQTEILLDATNRRGRTIQCRVTYNLLVGSNQERRGVILLMEEVQSQKNVRS